MTAVSSKQPFESFAPRLRATVPSSLCKDRTAARAVKNEPTPIKRAFDDDTVIEGAFGLQIVQLKAALIELAFHELAATKGRATKYAPFECGPDDDRDIE